MSQPTSVRRGLWSVFAVAVVGAAAAHFDVIGHVAYALERGRIKADQEHLTRISSQEVAALEGLSRAFNTVSAVVKPSVVNIQARIKSDEESDERVKRFFGEQHLPVPPSYSVGTGSGVVFDDQGYIITNNHVVGTAERVDVTLADGRQYKAKLIGADRMTDVAVVKIETTRLHPASFGDSDGVKVGDIVLAVGSPFRLDQTVSHGIISAKGRNVESLDIDYQDFLQTDAPINPGNSGGPLVNIHGEVIGINTAIATENGGYMGVGFSIPANKVRRIAEQLISGKKIERGFLGVSIGEVAAGTIEAMGLEYPQGAQIEEVQKDGPAGRAGISYGDIVLEVDGKPVGNSRGLTEAIGGVSPNTKVRMKIWRDGVTLEMDVIVGQQPEGFSTRPGRRLAPERSRDDDVSEESGESDEKVSVYRLRELGFSVTALTQELADGLRLKGVDSGAVVVRVEPMSDAWHAGLRRGDVIVQADKKSVRGIKELKGALTEQAVLKGVRMTVRTSEGSRSLVLRSN